MITISTEQLYNTMKQQEIMGFRIFDNDDNLVFIYNPESTQKSEKATTQAVSQCKHFFNGMPVKECKIRLKKFNNTKEEDEAVFRVRLDRGEEKDEQIINKPNSNPDIDISKTVKEQVNLELKRIKDEQKVQELEKKLERLEAPINRAADVLGKAAEVGANRLIDYMNNHAPNAAGMQGTGKEKDVEDIPYKEEKNPKTDEEKIELAIQILWKHGVDGDFLLALAHKVDADPSLLDKLQQLLNLPKLNKDG